MTKEKFVLVSLKEEKAKELAQVISNESCRKILDYLAENNDSTESELAQKLNIPISTVHYNLKHLLAGGLVTADEFHYSEKGKEVDHYKLANKYIIIAPKSTHGIKEKLRSILPLGILALAGAGFIQLFTKFGARSAFAGTMKAAAPLAQEAVTETADSIAAPLAKEAATSGANIAAEEVPRAAAEIIQTTPNYALWFLFGCLFIIVLLVIIELIKSKRGE